MSDRLIEQRLRNRVIESVQILADGDLGVRNVGTGEYFNLFFDNIDDDHPWEWRSWTTLSPAEVEALESLLRIVNEACSSTPKVCSVDELIATSWPSRIQPVAIVSLNIMLTRGRFGEDEEEPEPHASA